MVRLIARLAVLRAEGVDFRSSVLRSCLLDACQRLELTMGWA